MMKRYTKEIYVAIVIIAVVSLFGSYIPGLQFLAKWCKPPVMLFLGLAYAFFCGQGYPTFNKKISKALLQYSVVGLGFGMNPESFLSNFRGSCHMCEELSFYEMPDQVGHDV